MHSRRFSIIFIMLILISLISPGYMLPSTSENSDSNDSKFEPGFWEEVQKLRGINESAKVDVIVRINLFNLSGSMTVDELKVYAINVFETEYNASVNYVCKVLPYMTITTSVKEVESISSEVFVDILGNASAIWVLDEPHVESNGDPVYYSSLYTTTRVVRAHEVWDLGYTGSGKKIAIIDTGLNATYPDFHFANGTSKIVYEHDYTRDNDARDFRHHGTFVGIIAAGSGEHNFQGIAPEALLLNLKVINRTGKAEAQWIINALDDAVDMDANIINLSLHNPDHPYCDGTCLVSRAVDDTIKNGVTVVKSAGNKGPQPQTITCPGSAFYVITTGGILANNTEITYDDQLWENSSRGPTLDNRTKPDIVAPCALWFKPHPYQGWVLVGTGTSFAAPHVAGVAALLLQTHLGWTPGIVKSVIMGTARLNDNLQSLTENDRGKGIVDAERAVLCATDIPVDEAESKYEYGYGDYTAHAYFSGWYDLSAGTEQVDPPENYAITTLNKSFVPQHNLTNPKFFFGFHDKGYMNPLQGWADFRAIFKLYAPDGSLLFMLNPQIHYESTSSCYFDDYHTIDYFHLGTLIAQQTYTIEYGFSTYAHQAYSDFDWVDREAQALAITIVDLVDVGNPSFEERHILAPGVYGVPYWSMNNDGWREFVGDIDGDGDVDVTDQRLYIIAYRSYWTEPVGLKGDDWKADFDGDGDIDIDDQRAFVTSYQRYWTIGPKNFDGAYSWYTSGNDTYNMDQWLCDHDVQALKGQQVTFSFWFQPDTIGNNATAKITYITENNQQTTISGNWVYATEGWHNANITTTLPANTVAIKAIIHFTSSFQTWIDKASTITS